MPRRVPFSKYHGLGNDFLVIDRRAGDVPMDSALAVRLCDRHLGVGADGVLSVLAPSAGDGDVRMLVHNADGSEPETCGNGIRCVAWYVGRRLPEHLGTARLRIETAGGTVVCDLEGDDPERGTVRVDMGAPDLDETRVDAPFEVGGQALALTAVSMGNPHAVIFEGAGPEDAGSLGPILEHHEAFPAGVNAGFARVEGAGEVTLVVWERGCGLTLACGSGACAAVVAGVATGRLAADRTVTVHLPGGDLGIHVDAGLTKVQMTGPVVHVFDGEVDLDRFRRGAP